MICFKQAHKLAKKSTTSLSCLKKMYVMVGLLVEQYYEKNKLKSEDAITNEQLKTKYSSSEV